MHFFLLISLYSYSYTDKLGSSSIRSQIDVEGVDDGACCDEEGDCHSTE